EIENGVKNGSMHPRDAKMRLAREIVGAFYGDVEAANAQQVFIDTFQKGSIPEDIPGFKLSGAQTTVDILLGAGLATSKGEARRLIEQKGVKFEGAAIEDSTLIMDKAGVLQVGKRHFLRLEK
ncbi:MAG: tyrosine--tRNA ligase, partial [Anaerolineaceae bacterium]